MSHKPEEPVVDRELFQPLFNFFQESAYDPEELERFILKTGFPHYRPKNRRHSLIAYRGFALHAHVIHTLEKFAHEKDIDIVPSGISEGILPDGTRFFADRLNSMRFYTPHGTEITEIDGVYEFWRENHLTPIAFEVTFEYGRNMRSGLRRKLVESLYSVPPYLCEVRPTVSKHQAPLLYSGLGNRRYMNIPGRNFNRVSKHLMDLAYGNFRDLPDI